MILDEKLFINESNSKRLTYNEFVDYLDSIDNGYHAFSKVSGEMGSGYRYTLSNKLTQEQKDYLAQYSNVRIGDAKYKYAPEIKYDTVILLNRMPKTNPVKEDYDEDFFYTYEAIRHGESAPNRKYSGDFENEEEAVELAKDDGYDEVIRYTYDFISDNFDDYWRMLPRRTDTIWTKESGYINEDIVKTSKGKWVNKGKEGTHGEFSTKKKAREQQKAMFAQGFKGESLKEEYGPHKNEPYCEEIADDLENGRWIGETYNGTSWELTINGYSSDEFSPAFAEYLAREVSYPVRDGHLSYRDLDLIINKHDLLGDSNKYIPDLVKIGFDRETIDEWLKIPSQDEEIEIWVDYDLDFSVDDWKINESLDESIDRDSIESDFENITNMSDARERLKKYKIDLIKKDNRNYILRKDGKEYTFYVLDNPNEVRADLVKAVYKLIDSKRDSSITESKGVIRKYKGYTLHDTRDSITITDPHGETVGTERTESGAEGLIDSLVGDKNLKESIGSDIAEYQKWADYDMKKCGRISALTNHKIRKAGLKIVKDKYGDHEVIANEPVREDTDIQLIRKFYNEKTPKNRMELNHKLKDMGLKHGVSGVYSSDLEWVELNGKRYEIKKTNKGYSVTEISDGAKVEESLSNKELDNMIEIAHKIGLNTLDDLQDFLKRQQQPSDATIIDTLKRYSKEFDESKKYAKKTNESIDFSNEDYLLKPYWYSTTHGVTVGSIPKNVKIWTWFDGDNKSFFATSDIISTEDLKEYEIKEEIPNVEDIPEHSRIQIQKYLEQPITGNDMKISMKAQKVEEDLSADTNPIEPKDTGLAQLLIDAINGEWETIQLYNDISTNANNEKIAEIIKQINADEYTHVGLLQSALDLIAPNTNTNLEKGNEQASEIIDNKEEKDSISLPETTHTRVSVEDGEKLYDKYSTEMETLKK